MFSSFSAFYGFHLSICQRSFSLVIFQNDSWCPENLTVWSPSIKILTSQLPYAGLILSCNRLQCDELKRLDDTTRFDTNVTVCVSVCVCQPSHNQAWLLFNLAMQWRGRFYFHIFMTHCWMWKVLCIRFLIRQEQLHMITHTESFVDFCLLLHQIMSDGLLWTPGIEKTLASIWSQCLKHMLERCVQKMHNSFQGSRPNASTTLFDSDGKLISVDTNNWPVLRGQKSGNNITGAVSTKWAVWNANLYGMVGFFSFNQIKHTKDSGCWKNPLLPPGTKLVLRFDEQKISL